MLLCTYKIRSGFIILKKCNTGTSLFLIFFFKSSYIFPHIPILECMYFNEAQLLKVISIVIYLRFKKDCVLILVIGMHKSFLVVLVCIFLYYYMRKSLMQGDTMKLFLQLFSITFHNFTL